MPLTVTYRNREIDMTLCFPTEKPVLTRDIEDKSEQLEFPLDLPYRLAIFLLRKYGLTRKIEESSSIWKSHWESLQE